MKRLGNSTVRIKQLQSSDDLKLREDCRLWISTQLQISLNNNFIDKLKNGAILISLINNIKQNIVDDSKIRKSDNDFNHMENLNLFIDAAKRYGVKRYIFSPDDLVHEKNIKLVILCLHELKCLSDDLDPTQQLRLQKLMSKPKETLFEMLQDTGIKYASESGPVEILTITSKDESTFDETTVDEAAIDEDASIVQNDSTLDRSENYTALYKKSRGRLNVKNVFDKLHDRDLYMCYICGEPTKRNAGGLHFHMKCIKCIICKISLKQAGGYAWRSGIYCIDCYPNVRKMAKKKNFF